MQAQKYAVNQHQISTFLAFVKDGQIAIPEVQRPFVWDNTKVRDLMDSLYKGYPIGYVITFYLIFHQYYYKMVSFCFLTHIFLSNNLPNETAHFRL